MPSRWSISCSSARASNASASMRDDRPVEAEPAHDDVRRAPNVRREVGERQATFARPTSAPDDATTSGSNRTISPWQRSRLRVSGDVDDDAPAQQRRSGSQRCRRIARARASCRRGRPRRARASSSTVTDRFRALLQHRIWIDPDLPSASEDVRLALAEHDVDADLRGDRAQPSRRGRRRRPSVAPRARGSARRPAVLRRRDASSRSVMFTPARRATRSSGRGSPACRRRRP